MLFPRTASPETRRRRELYDREYGQRGCSIAAHMARSLQGFAHPIRRGIVERLGSGPATVGEVTKGDVSKPTISKHLKVLERSGVVVRRIEGRTHRLALDLDSLGDDRLGRSPADDLGSDARRC